MVNVGKYTPYNYMDPMGMFKGVSSSREPSSGPMLGQESPFNNPSQGTW